MTELLNFYGEKYVLRMEDDREHRGTVTFQWMERANGQSWYDNESYAHSQPITVDQLVDLIKQNGVKNGA